MGYLVAGLILAANTYTDCKRKEVLINMTMTLAAAGFIYRLFWLHNGLSLCLASMLPGIFLIAISGATQGKLGMGDGIVVLTAGLWIGFRQCAFMTMAALVLAVGYGAILWTKNSNKKEIPFLPFLLAGFLLSWFF